MTRARRNASALAAALALTAVLAATPAQSAGRDAVPEATESAGGFARGVVRRQNAQRRGHGMGRLRVSRQLSAAARAHARDMVRSHYFGHVSRSGRDVVDRVGATPYGGRSGFAVQENLYWWSNRRSSSAVVRAWMGSSVHRTNVLGRWRQVGVAAVMRSPFGRGGITVVAVYGKRH